MMRDNRAQGYAIEQWFGSILLRIHAEVKHVGAAHEAWDWEADGTFVYEVKACAAKIRNRSRTARSGRWHIDTEHHASIPTERRGSMFYGLVIHDQGTPKRAFLCSWAKMDAILQKHRRQGARVSVSSAIWAPQLFELARARSG